MATGGIENANCRAQTAGGRSGVTSGGRERAGGELQPTPKHDRAAVHESGLARIDKRITKYENNAMLTAV